MSIFQYAVNILQGLRDGSVAKSSNTQHSCKKLGVAEGAHDSSAAGRPANPVKSLSEVLRVRSPSWVDKEA